MEYRDLGTTGLRVSVVGFGCWGMGGQWWGPVDDGESIAAVHKALDVGVNVFDTADVYGFGRSERVLGEALESRRHDVIIASKVGLRWNNKGKVRHDLSRDHIFKAVDESLKRLKTDYIDLYQAHWPDPQTPISETVQALLQCVEAGKVRHIGASNLSPQQLAEYRRFGLIETLQPPLNMFERYSEVQLLPLCLRDDIGVLTYGSLCRGLLTGKFKRETEFQDSLRNKDPLFQEQVFERNLVIVDELKAVAEERGKTVAQLAVAWVLSHPAVSIALCGAKRPEQIAESAGGSGWILEEQDLKEIDQILTQTSRRA